MLQNILTFVLAFISTNIDDIFLLMMFFVSRRFASAQIILGQYLGIMTLVAISWIGSLIGNFVDQRYIGLLGLFPIYLAVKEVIELIKGENDDDEETPPAVKGRSYGAFFIAMVTIANGGDNIGIYVPLFTTIDATEKLHLVVVFLICTYLWCMAAKYLATHPLLANQLKKYGHIITPVVFFLLGLYIIYESDTFSLIIKK